MVGRYTKQKGSTQQCMQAAIEQVKKYTIIQQGTKKEKISMDLAKDYVKIARNQAENEQEMQKKPGKSMKDKECGAI